MKNVTTPTPEVEGVRIVVISFPNIAKNSTLNLFELIKYVGCLRTTTLGSIYEKV